MANPLDRFTGSKSADLKVRTVPSLASLISAHGLKDGVAMFDQEIETWRQDLQRTIPDSVMSVINQTVTTIQNQIVNSVSQSSGVTQESINGLSAQLANLLTQLQSLADDLAAHIAANVVHGTSSRVVGETDDQILERKTIGTTFPRGARFTRVAVDGSQIIVLENGAAGTVAWQFNENGSGYLASGAIVFHQVGKIILDSPIDDLIEAYNFKIKKDPVAGYVATSDASGNVTWTLPTSLTGQVLNHVTGPPGSPPSDPASPAISYGDDGTLYGWSVAGSAWVGLIV